MKSEKIDFILSFNNLKDIPLDKYENNFTFIVDGKRYLTSRIIVDLLSPKIRKLHFIDETIQEFCINTGNLLNSNDDKNDYFSEFLQLCTFDEYQLDELRIELFSTYFLKLGNIEEYFKLRKITLDTNNPEQSIQSLINIEKVLQYNSEEFDRQSKKFNDIISFISKHFHEISIEGLKKLSVQILHEIISSDTLVVRDEDCLLDTVLKLYELDRSYSILFPLIIFNNLSSESVTKFIKAFSFDDIDHEIWERICTRLVCSTEESDRTIEGRYLIKKDQSKEFQLEKGHEFEGIMKYLTDKTGGNIHDNGTIIITSNSIYSSGDHPKNLVDYKNRNYYYSKEDSNIYICFDFKDKGIQLSSYSIKSRSDDTNWGHLRNWVVEVSNDDEKYDEVDRHSNDSTLNEPNSIGTFKVIKEQTEFYRFIRLRQTGYSWRCYPNANSYIVYFDSIEFFGKLKLKEK